MDVNNFPMTPQEAHYPQQPHRQQQQQWPPHLLAQSHPHVAQNAFPSPPPPTEQGSYPFYQQQQQQSDRAGSGIPVSGGEHLGRSSLSLNLSSLTVASSNPSPINPSGPGLSPATPISPSANPFALGHHHIQSPFQYDQTVQNSNQQQNASPVLYDDHSTVISPPSASSTSSPYDSRRPAGPSRSSSATSSSSHLPRKRSFTSNASSVSLGGTLVEETLYDEARETALDLASQAGGYDDMEMRSVYGVGAGGSGGSPVDGSGSGSGDDAMGAAMGGMPMGMGGSMGVGGSMNVLGKPMATNNFVTKLYQMINDVKSTHYISWTDLGTSFVVSNVGEFSRSILGSHFKHNNFSSFVRQLNMYGFHKINRTPRAQRTSTDAQIWEFSHHKFLRGRPDLLDEIKRKALEPDPALKHRVELPGEVAAQLGAMRDENRRMWEHLATEKKRSEKLVGIVGRLWEVINSRFPGSVPPFPSELLDSESPDIYITSPTASTSGSRFPPPLSTNMHSIHSHSPNSSPTTTEFPHHQQGQQHTSLSRQHSFQQVAAYGRGEGTSSMSHSPGSTTMDLFDDGPSCEPAGRISSKRQRLSNDDDPGSGVDGSIPSASSLSSPGTATGPGFGTMSGAGKKPSRARSDSAPLGYGFGGLTSWQGGGGRPRSGSGLAGRGGVPNIGAMTRNSNGNGVPPLLSITTVPSNVPNR